MQQEAASSAGQSTSIVSLTPSAIDMVKKALAEEGLQDHGLRIAVQGGGCSGLQYGLDFEQAERAGDTVLQFDGLKVFIDMASAEFLKGTEIDYITSLQGAGFKFNNPNAKRTCGCGSSFS